MYSHLSFYSYSLKQSTWPQKCERSYARPKANRPMQRNQPQTTRNNFNPNHDLSGLLTDTYRVSKTAKAARQPVMTKWELLKHFKWSIVSFTLATFIMIEEGYPLFYIAPVVAFSKEMRVWDYADRARRLRRKYKLDDKKEA